MSVNVVSRIPSYVRRQGRLSPRQRHGLSYADCYGISINCVEVDVDQLFPRDSVKVLDIGFGMGEAFLEMATSRPQEDFLGVDVYPPGVGNVLASIAEQNLTNLLVCGYDAVHLVTEQLRPHSIDRVQVFFPDPWPKKRHHKRRLIQADFVCDLARIVKPGGLLHLATDWVPYAESMVEVLRLQNSLWQNDGDEKGRINRPNDRPPTKYEQRGLRLQHAVWDICFTRR